jgi:GTP-binding protein YchF
LEKDGHEKTGFPPQFIANLKNVDVLLILLRAFESDLYPHPSGKVDPQRDKHFIETEFILNDYVIIENRIQKLEKQVMKIQDAHDKKELEVLQKCMTHIEQEQPLRTLTLDETDKNAIRGFQFLSEKPVLFTLNIAEEDIPNTDKIIEQWQKELGSNCSITALSAEIEKEIAELEPSDAEIFLKDLEITEPAVTRLLHASYNLLGLGSFFTYSEKECRAWTFHYGITAQKAAGLIHTDMERGFIRAEVVAFEKLRELGSMQECKEKGQMRLEGKDYIVQDGDIMTIRFNV